MLSFLQIFHYFSVYSRKMMWHELWPLFGPHVELFICRVQLSASLIDYCFVFLLKPWAPRNKCAEALVPFRFFFLKDQTEVLFLEQVPVGVPVLLKYSCLFVFHFSWSYWLSQEVKDVYPPCSSESLIGKKPSLHLSLNVIRRRHKNSSLLFFIYLRVPHVW